MRRYVPEERRPQLHQFESQESRILHVSFQAIMANVVPELYDTVQGALRRMGGNYTSVLLFVFFFFFARARACVRACVLVVTL